MADFSPSCCDDKFQLLTKIILALQARVKGGVPATFIPFYADDMTTLYYKLAQTLTYL